MKLRVGAFIVVVAIVAVWMRISFVHPTDEVLRSSDSLVLTRVLTDAVSAEHRDSGAARIKIVYVQQDDATRRELIAKQADSLAQLAMAAHDTALAYQYEKRRADTLQAALDVSQKATENALASAAFFQLAYIADSTALQAERRNADRLAVALRQATGCTPWDYVSVGIGVGFKGPDVHVGLRYPLGRC